MVMPVARPVASSRAELTRRPEERRPLRKPDPGVLVQVALCIQRIEVGVNLCHFGSPDEVGTENGNLPFGPFYRPRLYGEIFADKSLRHRWRKL